MKYDTLLPLYVSVNILDDPPQLPLLSTYLMNDLFLNQKTNKNIRISYSLKYKHSKKKIIYKKINNSVVRNKHSGSSINGKPNSTMSVMFCTGANFVKKNSCLVAGIVSFDTIKS